MRASKTAPDRAEALAQVLDGIGATAVVRRLVRLAEDGGLRFTPTADTATTEPRAIPVNANGYDSSAAHPTAGITVIPWAAIHAPHQRARYTCHTCTASGIPGHSEKSGVIAVPTWRRRPSGRSGFVHTVSNR